GVKTLHLPASTGFTATLIGGAILAIGCPVAGYWSDKIARRPLLMVISCWLFVLTSYPAFYLMAAWPSLAACAIAVGWLQLVKAGYSGVLPSLLSEQFPVETRAIGVSLGFSTAVSIFGGLAPLVATWLIAQARGRAHHDCRSGSFRVEPTASIPFRERLESVAIPCRRPGHRRRRLATQ